MKVKINKSGLLEIERAGRWALQFCPYSRDDCGDWCPLFGEILTEIRGGIYFSYEVISFNICNKRWEQYEFNKPDEIIDER